MGLGEFGGAGSTVWVERQGSATSTTRVGDGYWLWKGDGFWHVLGNDERWSGGRASVTVTDPDDGSTMIQSGEVGADEDFIVMYVSPLAIGLKWISRSGQSPVPAGSDSRRTTNETGVAGYKNLKWDDLDIAVEVGSVFDSDRVRLLTDIGRSIAGGRFRDFLKPEIAPTSWTLTRELGQWKLTARILPKESLEFSFYRDYSVGAVNERSLGGNDSPGPDWWTIHGEHHDAFEFTTSPDGKLTAVVTPSEVILHESDGNSLKKVVQRIRVPAQRVVMTQWLEGSEVRKVAAAVSKIKR